jgi:hypothetical protein
LTKVEFSDDYICDEALRIVTEAEKEQVLLRLFGACAFRIHCSERRDLFDRFERHLSDIDFVTYKRMAPDKLELYFRKMGFKSPVHYVWHADTRQMFDNDAGLHVDVFRGDVQFCHTISFEGRLEQDFPTIPLAEMLLEKLQIVRITEKDMKDIAVLFVEHDVGASDKETINAKRIAGVMADDWGFYYTATKNLEKFKLESLQALDLNENEVSIIGERIEKILAAVELEPKSTRWKLRARVGTRKKWYNDVDEVAR